MRFLMLALSIVAATVLSSCDAPADKPTNYVYYASGQAVPCKTAQIYYCGATLSECANGAIYLCATNVIKVIESVK
jgi:hypothetical protein